MSVIKAKSKLPYEFTEAIYNKFSERNADKILEGMIDKYTTLRVNTLKSSNEEIIKVFEENGIDYDTVDWYENAFIIKNKNEIRYLQRWKNLFAKFIKYGTTINTKSKRRRKSIRFNSCTRK